MAFQLNKFESPLHNNAFYHGWNSPSVLMKKLFKCCPCIFVISLSSCWNRRGPSWITITRARMFCAWLKLTQRFWRRGVLLSSPSLEGRGPSFEYTLIPITQACSVPSLVEIVTAIPEKKMKMWTSHIYRQTSRKELTWTFSLEEHCFSFLPS